MMMTMMGKIEVWQKWGMARSIIVVMRMPTREFVPADRGVSSPDGFESHSTTKNVT
jgi:hypothetical protein